MTSTETHRAPPAVLRGLMQGYAGGDAVEAEADGVRLIADGSRPFLLVQRRRARDAPLVRGEASHLEVELGGDDDERGAGHRAREIVRALAESGAGRHGSFLVLEVWEGRSGGPGPFRVLAPAGPAPATVEALAEGLEDMDPERGSPPVEVEETDERAPPGLDPLLTVSECHRLGVLLLGLEVSPIFRDQDTGDLFPVYFRHVRRRLSRVLRKALFEFVRVQTGDEVPSHRALGRRSLDPPVWEMDRMLAEIDASFDLLLLVAPVNQAEQWERFREAEYREPPEFRYRLLPVDPDLLKRRLYDLPLEDVEDPAASFLLRDKREELDKQISLLAERSTAHFLHGSIRLFGHIEPVLLEQARSILEEVPPTAPRSDVRSGSAAPVDAAEFARRARLEYEHYRSIYPDFRSEIQVRPDLVGLMVSSGNLLIGKTLALRPHRVEALIQHEVGTHVVTFVNGTAQPLHSLSRGLADYDELQEGLGVLAEYLVDGLDGNRLRLLAARVAATQCRMDGADFIETFRRLHLDHGFTAWTAFGITSRIYQSGGFTRDIIYLRGFVRLIRWLRAGGRLEDLYVGKIAEKHIPVMDEFRERGVLRPAPLTPRFLERDDAVERLRRVREGLPLHRMVSA